MAERRPPGFNVDLDFYESDEVESLPRRIRAAAIGVWTLCGSYSAKRLSDGYVSAEKLKQLGCTPAIRAALLGTTKEDGTPSPLWLDAGNGAIRFDKWSKWQRTKAEVTAYRESEATRKRVDRQAKKAAQNGEPDDSQTLRESYVDATYEPLGTREQFANASRNAPINPMSSEYPEMSGRTLDGPSQMSGTPSTEYREQRTTGGYVPEESALWGGDERTNLSAPVDRSASRLVHDIVVKPGHGYSNSVLTVLRIKSSEVVQELGAEVAAETLRVWLEKELGPHALPSLTAEATTRIRKRNTPTVGRSDAEATRILADTARLARELDPNPRTEIEA